MIIFLYTIFIVIFPLILLYLIIVIKYIAAITMQYDFSNFMIPSEITQLKWNLQYLYI
jgi:hypothetical protein